MLATEMWDITDYNIRKSVVYLYYSSNSWHNFHFGMEYFVTNELIKYCNTVFIS